MTPNQTDTGAVPGVCDQTSGEAIERAAQALADDVWHPPIRLGLLARHEADKFRRQARIAIEASVHQENLLGRETVRAQTIEECVKQIEHYGLIHVNDAKDYPATIAAALVYRIRALATLQPSKEEAEIDRLRSKLVKRTEALEFVRDGYDNHDVSHVDYRVRVYEVALDALSDETKLTSCLGELS